jgi:hypothetical protein
MALLGWFGIGNYLAGMQPDIGDQALLKHSETSTAPGMEGA